MTAAATGSSVAPGWAISRYMAGWSGILTSAEQPASSNRPIMAVVACFTKGIPQGWTAVVAYQPWLNGEWGKFPPSFRDGALAPDPESRDSGFASRPGMTA